MYVRHAALLGLLLAVGSLGVLAEPGEKVAKSEKGISASDWSDLETAKATTPQPVRSNIAIKPSAKNDKKEKSSGERESTPSRERRDTGAPSAESSHAPVSHESDDLSEPKSVDQLLSDLDRLIADTEAEKARSLAQLDTDASPLPEPSEAAEETTVLSPVESAASDAQRDPGRDALRNFEGADGGGALEDMDEALTSEGPSLLDRSNQLQEVDLRKLFESIMIQALAPRTIELSLEDCVYFALRANQDIRVTLYEPLKADADILSAKGIYDPRLYSQANYLRASQLASSDIQSFSGLSSIETYRTTSQTGVQGLLPWGTQYNIALSANKEETTYTAFREQWYGGLTLSITQPLLRGWGRSVTEARIRIAENSRLTAENQLQSVVLKVVGDTVRAYWDLVGAIRNVDVREKALANAERLLDIVQKRLNIGTAAEIEVVQAKAGVATRQSDLVQAYSQVANAEDNLLKLMGLIDEDVVTPRRLIPTDSPDVTDITLNEVESVALAMQNRPEVESAQVQIESALIERKRAANDLLPQIDIVGGVSQGGRGHKTRDMFEGIRDRDDKSYNVGFQGSVPILNRQARGAFQRAELTARQAEQQLEQTRQNLILNVQIAVRNVATSRVLAESTLQTQALQEINLEAESKRLELGVTTSYRVLEVEEDLTLARTQHIQALVNFQQALTDLRLAEGTLLGVFGIEFQAPEPETPISYVRSITPFVKK